jgi:hypothetical protein
MEQETEQETEQGREQLTMRAELVVDERGRTSLAKVRSHDYDRYLVEEFPDGTLVLTPAVTVSAVELAALGNPDVVAAIAKAKSGDRSGMRKRDIPRAS